MFNDIGRQVGNFFASLLDLESGIELATAGSSVNLDQKNQNEIADRPVEPSKIDVENDVLDDEVCEDVEVGGTPS